MDKKQARALWDKYLTGEATNKEKQFIESWYNSAIKEETPFSGDPDWDAIERELFDRLPTQPKSRPIYRYAVTAAAILTVLAMGFYFFQKKDNPISDEIVNRLIIPGGNKATLTLDDGTVFDLSTEKQGVVVKDGITYDDGTSVTEHNQQTASLLLATPVGGQYQITLSDGTKVWLNASSSLQYPASFEADGERVVELTGEAYFEVKPDKRRPFKVRSEDQTVEVLGTRFNVNAYADEPSIKTTLLEGKVLVALASDKTMELEPNQQSVVVPGVDYISLTTIDPVEVIDWKNNDFTFNNESIESIMRKIARWYDVEIEFRGDIPPIGFGGTVSRTKNITEVLQILELTGAVHFKFEIDEQTGNERRIIVMP